MANSLVGASTRILGQLLFYYDYRCSNAGRMNAIVFPDPVIARFITSPPDRVYGIATD